MQNLVALLAKRGQCTYETKARVASTLTSPHGTVRFVIVYNDDPDGGMITMMPKSSDTGATGHDLYSELGLVFVSYLNGLGEFVLLVLLGFILTYCINSSACMYYLPRLKRLRRRSTKLHNQPRRSSHPH